MVTVLNVAALQAWVMQPCGFQSHERVVPRFFSPSKMRRIDSFLSSEPQQLLKPIKLTQGL